MTAGQSQVWKSGCSAAIRSRAPFQASIEGRLSGKRVIFGHQIRLPGPIVSTRCLIALYEQTSTASLRKAHCATSLAPKLTTTASGSHPCDFQRLIQWLARNEFATPK